ncbi:MAG: MliC family protein [Thermoanaerobaculia bacterium]
MEADVLWKAAMKPRLPTGLGKRFAFPTAPTAPASDEREGVRNIKTTRDRGRTVLGPTHHHLAPPPAVTFSAEATRSFDSIVAQHTALVSIGGCTHDPALRRVGYRCAGGVTIAAAFEGRKVVVTLPDGRNLTLEREPGGSGTRYSDGHVTLWIRGKEGFVEESGAVLYRACVEIPDFEAAHN